MVLQIFGVARSKSARGGDSAYFGGYINENFTQTFAALGLSAQQAWQLAHNSFEASFIDGDLRRRYQDRLQHTFETFS